MELSGVNAEETFVIQEILGDAHNYNRWLYDAVAPVLGRRVVDVGSGFGNVTKFLLDRELVVSLDVEPRYVESLRERFGSHPNYEAVLCDLFEDDLAPLVARRLDSATSFNVIEHVEDDVRFLSRIRELLTPGGGLGIVVPAMQVLYGSMDRTDRHFRRYGKKELREKLERAGFVVEDLRFINRLGAFGWFVNGRILKRRIIPSGQMGFYERIIPWMRRLERVAPLPFGQSLVALARKPR